LGILKEIVVIFQEIVSDPEFCIAAILKKLQSLDCTDFVLHADVYAMAVHVRMHVCVHRHSDGHVPAELWCCRPHHIVLQQQDTSHGRHVHQSGQLQSNVPFVSSFLVGGVAEWLAEVVNEQS